MWNLLEEPSCPVLIFLTDDVNRCLYLIEQQTGDHSTENLQGTQFKLTSNSSWTLPCGCRIFNLRHNDPPNFANKLRLLTFFYYN